MRNPVWVLARRRLGVVIDFIAVLLLAFFLRFFSAFVTGAMMAVRAPLSSIDTVVSLGAWGHQQEMPTLRNPACIILHTVVS